MNILVTGANGFLGKRLCKALLEQNNDVWAIVRDSKEVNTNESQLHFIELDLSCGINVSALPKKIDVVIHLAQSRLYREFPEGMNDMVNVNILTISGLLEYARKANCKQFIYTSTGSVYGDEHNENLCVNPNGAYAITKYCAELLMKPYEKYFKNLVFRPYFIYGPCQKGMLISNLIERVKNKDAITLQGSHGGMKFCPTYVDDAANVIVEAIKKQSSGTINLASPHLISIQSVAEKIAEQLGIEALFDIDETAEAPVFKPDLKRLSKWYDVENGFLDFEDGLKEIFATEYTE